MATAGMNPVFERLTLLPYIIMSHEIKEKDLTFSTVSPEWHGLANVVHAIDCDTIEKTLFDIVEVPNFIPIIGGRVATIADDLTKATFQKVDGKRLYADLSHREDLQESERFEEIGKASDTYETITNAESFDFMETILKGINADIVTAGTLDNGRKFYVSATTGDTDWTGPRGDSYESYINLVTSHDGTVAFTPHDSHTRVVCANTLRFSLSGAGDLKRVVKHTKNAKANLDDLAAWYNSSLAHRQNLQDSLNIFDSITCNREQVEGFSTFYFLNVGRNAETIRTEKAREKFETLKLSTRARNQVESIETLFNRGAGNRGATVYDLFNGMTDHYTNGIGTGVSDETTKARRWAKSEHGAASNHKTDFTSRLIESVTTGTFERDAESGAKVFADSLAN